MVEHQIAKITGTLLRRQLFEIHAPSFVYDDGMSPKELSDSIRNLAGYSLKQRDNIYVQLGTIDIIGSQSRQVDALVKMIRGEPALNERYEWADFGAPRGKKREASRVAHNIAAWINIVAHSKPSSDGYSEGVVAAAKRLWDRLAAQAVVISAQEGSCTFFLTPATTNLDASIEEKSKLFENAYRKYRTKLTGIENYPAKSDPTIHSTFIRFSVNMAPDPKLSVQVTDQGDFRPLIDPNADKFKLDYYPGRDYIKMSRVVDRDTSQTIAALFAEVVGSKIQDNAKKRCSFEQFDACRPDTLALPEESAKRGDRVWISAIDSSYLDKDGNIVSKNREYDYPYFENGDIYENLRKINQDTEPHSRIGAVAVKRETVGLDITFELHDFEDGGQGLKLFRDDFMKPIVIQVRPTGCNYLNKIKDLKRYHKDIIMDVLSKCDLLPKSREQVNGTK